MTLDEALIEIGELEHALAVLAEENQRLELELAKMRADGAKKKKRDMWSEPLSTKPRGKRSMITNEGESEGESIDDPVQVHD